MALIRYRDENGVVHEVIALKGDKGDPGSGGASDAKDVSYDGSTQYTGGSTVKESLDNINAEIANLITHGHAANEIDYVYSPAESVHDVGGALDYLFEKTGNGDNAADVANALKGYAAGEVVAISDASPLPHNINVEVNRKNLFNKENLQHGDGTGKYYCCLLEDGRIYVPVGYGQPTGKTLKELAPQLEVGKTYTISGNTTGTAVIHLAESKNTWTYGKSKTITQEDLDSQVHMYNIVENTEPSYITNFQIEEGTTATAYTPYLDDLSSVSLLKFGNNLFDATREKIPAYIQGNDLIFSNDSYSVAIPCVPNKTYAVVHANEANTIFRIGYLKNESLENIPQPGDNVTWKLYNVQRKTTEKSLAITTGDDATFIIVQIASAQAANTIRTLQCCDVITAYDVDENGEVDGVTLDYPITTLSTDTNSALVNVVYNKDINKAFDALVRVIISLGGNV